MGLCHDALETNTMAWRERVDQSKHLTCSSLLSEWQGTNGLGYDDVSQLYKEANDLTSPSFNSSAFCSNIPKEIQQLLH